MLIPEGKRPGHLERRLSSKRRYHADSDAAPGLGVRS